MTVSKLAFYTQSTSVSDDDDDDDTNNNNFQYNSTNNTVYVKVYLCT